MQVKTISKWLKSVDDADTSTGDVVRAAANTVARDARRAESTFHEESAFDWRGNDDDYDVEALRGTSDELASSDTVPVKTLSTEDDPAYSVEENPGIDPYNSGYFKVS